jgi:carbon monoxide dehydrogenase subunit G
MNILDSAITGNTDTGAAGGGGIDNFMETLNVANSTISGNSTNGDGGGIRAHGLGHSTKLTHVTISNNTADGSSGGGIKHSGGPAIQVKNNLVAGNSVGISGSGPDCHGNFSSLGYNLIGDNSGCNICFPEGNPNPNDDYVGTGISPLDPQIDGLTGNPAYHPLQADSPAIDKVPIGNCTFISSGSNPLFSDGAAVTTDQRGEPRPANVTGGGCDIGAFETQPEINVFHKNASIPNGTGSVDLGQTPVGIPLTETFTVSNTGTFTLTLTEPITVPAGFSVASSFGSTSLAAGDATTFSVRLDAAALGTYSGTLEFANNDADENPYTFTIRGEVLEMEIVVLDGGINIPNGTGSVDFGQTPMGIPLTETFTVSNTGTFTLTLIEPITVPAGFSVASSFGRSSLAAGDATTFAVRLDAAALGTYSGTLEFANNDADENPFNFTLEGTVAESSCYLPVILRNP